MKIFKSKLSIILIIITSIIFVILTPSIWKNQIQDQLNEQLSERGDWEVKFHKLRGHLLFNISIDSLYLSNPNSSNVFISRVDMRLNLFKSLFSYPSIKYLKLVDLNTNLFRSLESADSKSDPFELKSILEQMKEIKLGLKGYKYLDEAIELANELGLAITDAEIVRTNSTGLTIYNPKNLADRIKGMKNKRVKTKAEKIAERLKYEAENGSVKFEKTETSLN